jgi:hypothetical protein
MRLTKEAYPKTGKNVSGVRKCDSCNKEEFIAKPKRWDMCINCIRKELYKTGKNVAPKYVKKVSFVNFCLTCDKCFSIKSEYYRNQTFCSATCWGDTRKGISPANKIWDSLEDRSDYYYQKYKADPKRWLAILVRNRVKVVLKTQVNRKRIKNINIGKTEEMIGCTTEFLMKHIESQFELNMTWENWGLHGWHIDHIYPLSKFNLTDREQLLQACNYRNLKPMWATENRKKHAKIVVSLEDVMNKEYNYDC